MTTNQLLLAAATLFASLVAGLLFAYACSVNPGLARLSDKNYLAAMQSINRAIQNPIFFVVFIGALILLIATTWIEYRAASLQWKLILTAMLLYAVGVFGVTMLGNVPLNAALEKFDIGKAGIADLDLMRRKFQSDWNRLHLWRTIASVIVAFLMIIACVKNVGPTR